MKKSLNSTYLKPILYCSSKTRNPSFRYPIHHNNYLHTIQILISSFFCKKKKYNSIYSLFICLAVNFTNIRNNIAVSMPVRVIDFYYIFVWVPAVYVYCSQLLLTTTITADIHYSASEGHEKPCKREKKLFKAKNIQTTQKL